MFNRKIINYLRQWKDKPARKPLVLRGARQVGKTSAVLIFARENFNNHVYINLEKAENAKLFREDLSLADFETIIKVKLNQDLIDGETLLFLDEIQNCPSLIKLLRFFFEDRPTLHVIAAGSLLEAKIEQEGFSLPVGRVEFAYLYPLDFFEYLTAKRENNLFDFLSSIKLDGHIPQGIHQQAMDTFIEYTMVGGMPEAVAEYLKERDFRNLKTIYNSLFTGYIDDVYKYSSQADAKYLNYIIENSPLFAGTTITYDKFGGSNFRSREMSKAFSILEKVMLLNQLPATKSQELPLIGQEKRPKKLLFLDVGLVNHAMGIREEYISLKDLNHFYRGRIAEQVIGQNIISQFIESPPFLFYWAKDKKKGSAELDFCAQKNARILGIEVKSGTSGRLKSLMSFSQEVKSHCLARIYGGNLRKERITVGKDNAVLWSLPFYLITRIFEICDKKP
jgi:uncharacterized protein